VEQIRFPHLTEFNAYHPPSEERGKEAKTEDLSISGCPNLKGVLFPKARKLKNLVLDSNPLITILEFPAVKSVNLTLSNLRSLRELVLPETRGGAKMVKNDGLKVISGEIEAFHLLQIESNSNLETISFPSLTILDSFLLFDCPKVVNFTFPSLEEVESWVLEKTGARSFSLPVPEFILDALLKIHNNSNLIEVNFPNLIRFGYRGRIAISNNTELTTIAFPKLGDFQVLESVNLTGNPKLQRVDFSSLSSTYIPAFSLSRGAPGCLVIFNDLQVGCDSLVTG